MPLVISGEWKFSPLPNEKFVTKSLKALTQLKVSCGSPSSLRYAQWCPKNQAQFDAYRVFD